MNENSKTFSIQFLSKSLFLYEIEVVGFVVLFSFQKAGFDNQLSVNKVHI
jgi:hypothetical protein